MMPLNFSSTRSQMILLLKYCTGSHCIMGKTKLNHTILLARWTFKHTQNQMCPFKGINVQRVRIPDTPTDVCIICELRDTMAGEVRTKTHNFHTDDKERSPQTSGS